MRNLQTGFISPHFHVIYGNTFQKVMGSAAEAEIGASYLNAQEILPIRVWLEEMATPNPPP